MVAVSASRSGDGWVCLVSVDQHGRRTQHTVTVSIAELARWASGSGQEDVEELVRRSFDFLLEREPATSIQARFDLSAIQRYFPEYDRIFRR